MESDSGPVDRVRRAGALQLSITVCFPLMSEMELSLLRQRSLEALRQKARRGELFLGVAVGYVKVRHDRIAKDRTGTCRRRSGWCSGSSLRCRASGRCICGSVRKYLDAPLRNLPTHLFSSEDHAARPPKARSARSCRRLADDSLANAASWALSQFFSPQPRPRRLARRRRIPVDRDPRPRLPSANAKFVRESALGTRQANSEEPRR